MDSLKDRRVGIVGAKATQKITKAMQMVAASKRRRATAAAEAARPYAERMEKVLANIATSVGDNPGAPRLLTGTGSSQSPLLLVCTGERGLCGPFNSAIVRLARDRANSLLAEGKDVKFLCVGRKGFDQLKRQFEDGIIETVDLRSVRQLKFENAGGIGHKIIALFKAGQFDVCTLFFSRFKSVMAQIPTAQQLIPAVISSDAGGNGGAVYEYEPDEEDILAGLFPRNISGQIFRVLLENMASLYCAQMTAMGKATRNAADLIRTHTLIDNRTRQAMITKELIEIISR